MVHSPRRTRGLPARIRHVTHHLPVDRHVPPCSLRPGAGRFRRGAVPAGSEHEARGSGRRTLPRPVVCSPPPLPSSAAPRPAGAPQLLLRHTVPEGEAATTTTTTGKGTAG